MKIHGYVDGLKVCHIVIDGGHGFGTGWITPICGASQLSATVKRTSEMKLCKRCELGLEKRLAMNMKIAKPAKIRGRQFRP